MTFDPRLYLVTGPTRQAVDLEHVVAEALAGGVTTVQLRDKTRDRLRLERRTQALAVIAEPFAATLIVNDDIDVAGLADGVHVGVGDERPESARISLGGGAVIGWSINDLAQLDDAVALDACDYIAVSPVWATPSKPEACAPLGLEGIRAIRALTAMPLLAIGGISASNAADVIAAGADGIAVMSAVCLAVDPRTAARELRAIVDSALSERGSRA